MTTPEYTPSSIAKSADMANLLADGRPLIYCPCGFLAISNSAVDNQCALEEHRCPNAPVQVGGAEPWYAYVFSFWGFVALMVIVALIAALAGVDL